MRGLREKIVVVAGGAGGIGTATSTRLAEEGARVVVADLNLDDAESVAEAITAAGGLAVAVHVDVTDDESVRDLMAATVEIYGGVDALHSNVGGFEGDGDVMS